MIVLALNCGSSSVKAALIEVASEQRLRTLHAESIGSARATLHVEGETRPLSANSHAEAINAIVEIATATKRPAAVAHRVTHGGTLFTEAVVIGAAVEAQVEALSPLAPLHNPIALAGIRAARRVLPDVPHVAVFDTAFHDTLPAHARQYALPSAVAERFGIRRFGFHGTSHAYVAHLGAEFLRASLQTLRIVSCHLGNGASVAAIEYGRSVETSMGMTPLEGLIMGSRAGDIDAGVLMQLLRSGEFDVDSLDTLLNRDSGLEGMTGTNDLREIERRAAAGDESCRLAIDAYVHRLRKYIGAYAAVMDGVDAIVFTGGVGENSATVRNLTAGHLSFLGVTLDEDANRKAKVDSDHPVARISIPESKVSLLVVHTDEELAMATAAAALIEKQQVHSI